MKGKINFSFKEANVIDLKKGDLVFAEKEFGRVISIGRTWIHKHFKVTVEWFGKKYFESYMENYYFEDEKKVYVIKVKKIIRR